MADVMSQPADTLVHAETVAGRHGGTLTPIRDSERARELAMRSVEKRRKVALSAMAAAGRQLPDVAGAGPYAYLAYMLEQHALNATDPSARGSVASAKLVMGNAFPEDKSRHSADTDTAAAFGAGVGVGVVRELLAEVRQLRAMRD